MKEEGDVVTNALKICEMLAEFALNKQVLYEAALEEIAVLRAENQKLVRLVEISVSDANSKTTD